MSIVITKVYISGGVFFLDIFGIWISGVADGILTRKERSKSTVDITIWVCTRIRIQSSLFWGITVHLDKN